MADENSKKTDDYLFPYSKPREIQNELIQEVWDTIKNKSNLIVHAPTGLGKTAATLAPALKYALENKKKVFFLTSRHTQHIIAIETLKEIKKKHDIDFTAVDMIGKKWMCTVTGAEKLHSNEFYEYCKKQREDGTCEQYSNTKSGNKLTTEAKLALDELKRGSPCHIEQFTSICGKSNLCAYELATALAKDAAVIVTDYYYIYHPKIRESFFNRAQVSLSDCIVIADEGHNLPDRIRNLMTAQLSNYMIKRASNEAKKIADGEIIEKLSRIQEVLNVLSQGMRDGDEKEMTKESFVQKIKNIQDYESLIEDLQTAADQVREQEKQSSLGSIATFLQEWRGGDAGYARILSQKMTKRESVVFLSYRCLDPSIVSRQVIEDCHSTIIMSGTLTPTSMYKDLLGFPSGTTEKVYSSPFPTTNKLSLIVPETTTKFSMRNPKQYERIAKICSDITNIVPGNSAIFFPSYYIRDQVYAAYSELTEKTAFLENTDMNKEEKGEFLERFKAYKNSGAVLLGVVSGSFGEGIDLPGDLLKCVVVVGLPLQQPTLETKKLISYYDEKFGKGWDYGYVSPAFSKCMQSAGRCIRSETDRGIIVFLDERYAWQNYRMHFPADLDLKITLDHKRMISAFFNQQ